MGDILLEIIKFGVPTAAAILGWAKWLHELRAKHSERKAKEKAELELKSIHRRSLEICPYFTISDHRFNMLMFRGDEPGQHLALTGFEADVLCEDRLEIKPSEVPDGSEVFLLVENIGRAGVEVRTIMEGVPVRRACFDKVPGLFAFRYPYLHALHGKEQVIELSFLAMNGVRDTHRYRTKHGVRLLERIDPV